MPTQPQTTFEARKSPVQARSTASVSAILDATIQVLLRIGKEQLTTTRVAARAGVSVGTLYQYFPNKSALLQAVLERHLNDVTAAVEAVCLAQHGAPLRTMATALITRFLEAKMSDVKTSAALYAVSSDLDGARIARLKGLRTHKAIAGMLASSPVPLATDPELIATMLQGAMVGVSRRLLESPHPGQQFPRIREELIFLACSYLEARATASTS